MKPVDAALHAQGLSVGLGGQKVLDDVHVGFERGCWTSVVGPNGAGKTTLLKALAGLLPFEGEVVVGGQSIQNLPAQTRARQLAWLGQFSAGDEAVNAWDVVMLGRLPHQRWWQGASANDQAVVQQVMAQTQCWHLRQRTLAQLAGGERQRV